MAAKYKSKKYDDILFEYVPPQIIPMGAQVGAARYVIDNTNNITVNLPVINAIDIHWNHVGIPDTQYYLDTTDDLIEQLKIIHQQLATGTGQPGKSAYEIAVEHGYVGTEEEWLESLHGATGESAYQCAVEHGYIGTEEEWLASLQGVDGKSAYEIAYKLDPTIGTEEEWIASLKGDTGAPGESAYQVAVEQGYTGSESEWLESLKGDTGATGPQGPQGDPGAAIRILGYYNTLQELIDDTQGQVFTDGDAFVVDKDVYVYNTQYDPNVDPPEAEWINVGKFEGESAYEIAVRHGYIGTEEEWLESLHGPTYHAGTGIYIENNDIISISTSSVWYVFDNNLQGDVEDDGDVDENDYGLLTRIIHQKVGEYDVASADVNRDGYVSSDDLTKLREILDNNN